MEAWTVSVRAPSYRLRNVDTPVRTRPGTRAAGARDDSFDLVSSTESHLKPLDEHGNLVLHNGVLDPRSTVTFAGRNNRLVIEGDVKLDKPTIRFHGDDGEVIIGALAPGAHLNVDIVVADGASVVIGSGVTSEKSLKVRTAPGARVKIGDDTHVGSGVNVNADDPLGLAPGEGERRFDITIGSHVWLIRGTEVRAGADIGDGSVLEQVPLVDDVVPSGQLVRGLPAEAVRPITWDRSQLA